MKVLFIILHNCVVHPLLPLADGLNHFYPANFLSRGVYWMHDSTAIKGYG